ncbi:MAG: LPS export ABC transporter permease LptG [Pseudomonadota bacterium]
MILRRYLMREIGISTLLVFAALLTLFAFFDLIHELSDLGVGDYRLPQIFLYVLLTVPGHVYELAPIAALIGSLFALAQLASGSEFTVMRVSGMSAPRMVATLAQIGLVVVVATFLFGEFIGPASERAAQQLRLQSTSAIVAQEFRSGLWVKDEMSFVNVMQVLPDTTLLGVNIYQFDPQYRLRSISYAQEGRYVAQNQWHLRDVVQTRFDSERTAVESLPEMQWNSVLTPDLLTVLLVMPEQMSVTGLYAYIEHLRDNHMKTLRYEIAMWSKLTYPLAILVMMVLALPFAYHQQRAGGVGTKIFAGIILGLVFHLSNRLFAHIGLLNEWPALFSAALPTLLFSGLALGLLWRVERR